MRVIPLASGNAHFQFDSNLAGVRLRFRMDWLTRWGYYGVTIFRDGNVIAAGRALHPGIDLLRGLNLNAGTLILEGSEATVSNLGERNRLVHREPGE